MLARERLREGAEDLLRQFPERYRGTGMEPFVELDRERRESVTKVEEKRRRRNEISAVRGKPDPAVLEEMQALKDEIRALEAEDEGRETQLPEAERGIPDVAHPPVPRRKDESGNRIGR